MACAYQIHTVREDTLEMDYILFGNGAKKLVILPGISVQPVTGSAAAIAEAYAPLFAETYTVYLPTGRKQVEAGYSVDDMADDTAVFCRLVGIETADVFGASLGGMVAQRLAICYPSLVHKLILGSTISCQNAVTRHTLKQFYKPAARMDVRALNRTFFEYIYSPETLAQFGEVLTSLEDCGTPEDLHRFCVLVKAAAAFDTYDELGKIQCPTLVLGAKNDRVVSGEASLEIARKIGCEVYLYEQFGHAVYDEAPDYKQRMIDFFSNGERKSEV